MLGATHYPWCRTVAPTKPLQYLTVTVTIMRNWECWELYLFGNLSGLLVPPVEDLFKVVHPHLSQTHLVASDHLRAFGEGVRTLRAKHMTND